VLNLTNVSFFKRAVSKLKKDSPNELSACCPICADTKYRLHLVHVKEGYDYIRCFNEGCPVSEPTTMLNFLYQSNGDVLGYKRATYATKLSEIKNDLSDVLVQATQAKEKLSKPPEKEIPQLILNSFVKCNDSPECKEYFKARNVIPPEDTLFSKIKFFTFNNKTIYLENYIIIPIYSNLKFKGFYSRSIYEKKFSTFLLPDTEKIWVQDPSKLPELITEGIFDALSIHPGLNLGAMLGADISEEYRNSLPKNTIFAFDNDQTGTQKAIKYANLGFTIFVWPDINEKDFNELLTRYSKMDILKMIQNNLRRGIEAEVLLRMKTQ